MTWAALTAGLLVASLSPLACTDVATTPAPSQPATAEAVSGAESTQTLRMPLSAEEAAALRDTVRARLDQQDERPVVFSDGALHFVVMDASARLSVVSRSGTPRPGTTWCVSTTSHRAPTPGSWGLAIPSAGRA